MFPKQSTPRDTRQYNANAVMILQHYSLASMSYPAFPQYSSVDYSKKKNRRGTGVSITENSEAHVSEGTELRNIEEVKSQNYVDVDVCEPDKVQETIITADSNLNSVVEEPDKTSTIDDKAKVESELQVAEEKIPIQRAPYMPINTETLEPSIAANNITERYEKAIPKSKEVTGMNVSSHNFRKIIICVALMNIALCLTVCGMLGYAIYDLHKIQLQFSTKKSCPSAGPNSSDVDMLRDEDDGRLQCISDQCQNSLQYLNYTILSYFQNSYENQVLLIDILKNPNQLFNFSCASIYAASNSSPSGYYWFRAPNGSFVSMYCDMDRICGGMAGGWTRLVKWNTSECNAQCPPDFVQLNNNTVRSCGIRLSHFSPVCSTVNFSLPNQMKFSKICGRIKTHSLGSPDAFNVSTTTIELDSVYVDGISLTHGSRGSRTHIWTVAVSADGSKCPCSNRTGSFPPPSFVGDDYFCFAAQKQNCSIPDSCCHSNSPLWFYKELQTQISDPIELRACADESRAYEDVAIEAVEIYVQ